MASKPPTTIATDADRFEATLKAAKIDERLHDGLWDVWIGDPAKAHLLVTRFKDNGQTSAIVKHKQAPPDPVEQAIERLRTAARAAGQVARDDELVQQIDALAAAFGRLTTPAGQRLDAQQLTQNSGGAAYKSAAEAQLAQTAHVFGDDGRPLFRPVWDPKTGKALP